MANNHLSDVNPFRLSHFFQSGDFQRQTYFSKHTAADQPLLQSLTESKDHIFSKTGCPVPPKLTLQPRHGYLNWSAVADTDLARMSV